MPLFNYKCTECENVVEKFLLHADSKVKITCECGCIEHKRLISFPNCRTQLNAADSMKQNILPEVKRIKDRMASGSDADFFDIYGDK